MSLYFTQLLQVNQENQLLLWWGWYFGRFVCLSIHLSICSSGIHPSAIRHFAIRPYAICTSSLDEKSEKNSQQGCIHDSISRMQVNSGSDAVWSFLAKNQPRDGWKDRQCELQSCVHMSNKFVYTTGAIANVGQGHWWKLVHFLAWIPR